MSPNAPLEDILIKRDNSTSIYEIRKRILLETNFWMAITGGILFAILNYTRGLFLLPGLQAILCILFLILLVLVRKKHSLAKPASWAIIMVFITMFLRGRRSGLIICIVYIILTVITLWWKYGTGGQQLALIGLANFTVLYAVSFVFAIYSENTRLDVEKQLKETNLKLEIHCTHYSPWLSSLL